MITFYSFINEAKYMFPQEKTGAIISGPLKLRIKEVRPGAYVAYHKNKKVGAAITWNDINHGKFSIYKSATHPDYQRMGIMRQLYQYIEQTTGKQLTPATALSDDGFEFWKRYRPEAVKDDLRNMKGELLGKTFEHPKYGKVRIDGVGSGVVRVTLPDEYHNTTLNRKKLIELGVLNS